MSDPDWRSACIDLAVDSYLLIDSGQAVATASLFTEDAEYSTPMGTLRGRKEIARVMTSRESDPERRTRHVLGSHSVRLTGECAAKGSFVLCVYIVSDPAEVRLVPAVLGDVVDRYMLTDDGWRISHRALEIVAARR